VWFDKLMVEVRVVRQIDGGSSCGSTNSWWSFLFHKLMFVYFTCVYVLLLLRVLFVLLSFLGLGCLYIRILWCKAWSK
jgi:hypothetical protein